MTTRTPVNFMSGYLVVSKIAKPTSKAASNGPLKTNHNLTHINGSKSTKPSYQLAKTSTTITFSDLSVLSGLTLTTVVIALVAAPPLLVIFSKVLVPTAVAMLLLTTGLVMSGGLGATAVMVFY
ncbi:hypothetical protein ACFX13_038464 [Malus domestica]